jgi:REP element-mobilizing transposase RayT
MNRGVNRNRVFADDQDREYFSRLVGEYKEACGAKVYHWVWMGNHYHMLVEVVYVSRPALFGNGIPGSLATGYAGG